MNCYAQPKHDAGVPIGCETGMFDQNLIDSDWQFVKTEKTFRMGDDGPRLVSLCFA